MKDQEARLLLELRKMGVWELKGGSFEVHFDSEGKLSTIEVRSRHRIQNRLSTIEEIESLTA